MLVSVILLQVLLFRSRWGPAHPLGGRASEGGRDGGHRRHQAALPQRHLGGIFAGLAGAYLTIEFGNAFQGEMTAGRGYIALAALIFGRWTPIGAFGAALLFTSAGLRRRSRSRHPRGALGEFLSTLPSQFYSALPYIITIIVLAGVVGRGVAPAAVGRPYERESKAA